MYHSDDPPSQLAATSRATFAAARAADLVEFARTESKEPDNPRRPVTVRMQNAVVSYAEAQMGDSLKLAAQVFEYAVLLPDHAGSVRITHGGTKYDASGFSVSFVPPGESSVDVTASGRVIRVIPIRRSGPLDEALNAKSYATDNPRVAPLEPWPSPPEGWRVRTYSLDVPNEEGRFGRIFRCTTLTINWLEIDDGPRDPSRLSPHSHDDFEQCSLALEGTFTHHLRWPWTPNLAEWRTDEHLPCKPPSALVIPPGVIHTTEMTGRGRNVLVDIFCPPRTDFARKPGWVLNDTDYAAN